MNMTHNKKKIEEKLLQIIFINSKGQLVQIIFINSKGQLVLSLLDQRTS